MNHRSFRPIKIRVAETAAINNNTDLMTDIIDLNFEASTSKGSQLVK